MILIASNDNQIEHWYDLTCNAPQIQEQGSGNKTKLTILENWKENLYPLYRINCISDGFYANMLCNCYQY